ncbi:unnamed protein product [Auanema sp. JU1783]|nr:unnamed protein product [Auanema sp. JU1783]
MWLPSVVRVPLGWCFGISILLTSVFGNYMISLFLFLIPLGHHKAWRFMMDRAISFWMTIPMGFLEFIFGMTVRVSGDEIDVEEPGLILMNHRTRLDWMYIWSLLYQMNPWLITTNKISLKAQLKKLPGAGFGMAANQFVFLERNIEVDKVSFDKAIDYYTGMGNNYQILLFPEGTDKSPWTTTKSLEYSKKNGLRQLQYLLYPRTTGFYHLLSKMRQSNYITYLYDVTVAYPHNIVQSEIDLVLKGSCPREVHFHVKKIDVREVPKDEAGVGRWLTSLWIEKEERLCKYYAEPIPSKRMFDIHKGQRMWTNKSEGFRKRLFKIAALLFWFTVVSIVAYHVCFIWTLQYGFTYFFIVSFILTYYFGGIDTFVYNQWRFSVKDAIV